MESLRLSGLISHPWGNAAQDYKAFKSKSRGKKSHDPFNNLPEELRRLIIAQLPSHDIASLRLSSRSFRELSKSLFKRLLQEEMPWFWEIEDVEEAYYAKDDKGSPEQNENEGDKGESGDKKGTQKAEAVNWLEVWVQLQSLKRGINGVRNRVRV